MIGPEKTRNSSIFGGRKGERTRIVDGRAVKTTGTPSR
jgi:hypothetical protein